jgi:hypothetical protein
MKAFPLPSLTVKDNGTVLAFTVENPGMDLRDYFAAKVMHYWLSNPMSSMQIENMCKGAYQIADEMMKERVQNGPQN